MTEGGAILVWATSLLSASAGVTALVSTRIYASQAPQNTDWDYIILSLQSYNEIGTNIKGELATGKAMLLAKAVTKASGFLSAENIYAAIHAALQGQSGTSEGVNIESCIRISLLPPYPETKDGVRYNHYGGLYQIIAVPS